MQVRGSLNAKMPMELIKNLNDGGDVASRDPLYHYALAYLRLELWDWKQLEPVYMEGCPGIGCHRFPTELVHHKGHDHRMDLPVAVHILLEQMTLVFDWNSKRHGYPGSGMLD